MLIESMVTSIKGGQSEYEGTFATEYMDFAAPAFGRGCFGRIFRQSVRRLFRAGLAGVWQQFRADLAARAGPWRTDIAVWLYHTLHHRRPYRHRTGIFSLPPAVK